MAQNILALLPEPNIPGAAIGQNNYVFNSTREKTTNAVNAKLNYNPTHERPAVASASASSGRRSSTPAPSASYGGPANGGFGGTGTRTPTAAPSPGRGRSARA